MYKVTRRNIGEVGGRESAFCYNNENINKNNKNTDSYTLEDGHIVKDSGIQRTIKLHADGNISCNTH
jgi:hypothetical protein